MHRVKNPVGRTMVLREILDIAAHRGVFQTSSSITWSTETFGKNQNANAIRFGTLYNFRFDADHRRNPTNATVGYFKTGGPMPVLIQAPGGGPTPSQRPHLRQRLRQVLQLQLQLRSHRPPLRLRPPLRQLQPRPLLRRPVVKGTGTPTATANGDGYSYSYANSDRYCYIDSHGYSYGDCDSYSYGYYNFDAYSDRYTFSAAYAITQGYPADTPSAHSATASTLVALANL